MKTEKEHIAEIGEDKFEHAVGRALFRLRQDGRLVGLDKIRNAVAREAALQATGFPKRPLNLPKACGEMTISMREIIDGLFPGVIEAAKEKA